MATPAFRAAGTAVFSANNVANPTALAPTKSGSTVNGDLMLCITECRSITATVATPTGWTLLTGFPIRSGTASGGSVYVFSRIATGGADDAPSISWSGVTTGTNGDSCGARILAWSGAEATQVGTVTSTDAASTTTVTMPAITTTSGNALIVGIVVKINDTVHTWGVATRTERSDDHTTTGTGHGTVTCDLVQQATGASGTSVATPSTTVSSRTLAISVAMKGVPVTATVNQITETDTARRLAVPFGRATETDTARAIAVGGIDVGRVTETETAQALTRTKKRALGQASDTETARAVYASPYDATIDADSPISHWKLGETSGTTAFDRKGVSDGTLSNPTEYTLGRPGLATRNAGDKAILFQETGGTCGYITIFDPGAPYDVTRVGLEAWVSLASDAAARSQRVVNGSSWKLEVSSARKARFYAKVSGVTQQITGTTTLSLSTRYHLLGTYDGQFLRIYVNGALDGTLDLGVVVDLDASTTVISISNLDSVFSWEGTADEVALYGSALALARIQAHFDAGRAIFLAIGQASDAETAGALTRVKTKAIAQASDTETAGATGRLKTKAIAQASDTETAAVLTPVQTGGGQTIAVGQTSETDTAGATTARKTLAIGQASDTETAGATGRLKTKAIAQASDTETASAITSSKLKAIGQPSEADTARTMVIVDPILRVLGQASDTETAGSTGRLKTLAIGQASEADTARTMVIVDPILRAIAQASETDTAGVTGRLKTLAIGQASDTETARTMVIVDPILRAIAQASDTETAGATGRLKTKAVAQAADAETAGALTHSKLRAIAQASDTETAGATTARKTKAIGQASDSETAGATTSTKVVTTGQASDTETARTITRRSIVAQSTESDTAAPIAHNGTLAIGEPSETDTATALTRLKVTSLGRATETDVARALALVRGATVGQVTDLQVARALDHSKVLAIGRASELDVALAVTVEGAGVISVETAIETGTAGALGHSKVQGLGLATDLETALALVAQKVLAIAAAAEADSVGAITSEHIATIGQAAESDEAAGLLVIQTTPPLGQAVETSTAGALILVLPDSEEEEDDVVLFSITPDMSGFEEAQERLRSLMGVDISFYWPTVTEWPADTPLNPETGRPFDPTVVPAASGYASASVRCSIVHRPIRGSVEDQTENNALARLDAKNVGLIMNFGAFPSAATEFEWLDRRYKIVDHLSDALSTARRDLAFGEMM